MHFSCIVPVYNIEKEFLKKCIDSVLHQTYKDFELIIVDDGSEPKTAEFCDYLGKTDSRIVVIHQQNRGLAGARNAGVAHAHGEWIVHVDGDDWVEPVLLQELSISTKNDVDIVLFGYSTNKSGKKNEYLLKDKSVMGKTYDELRPIFLQASMKCGSSFSNLAVNTTWGKAFRAEFVRSSGIAFNEELRRAQDVPYSLAAFSAARKVAYIDKALYVYRLDNESLSRGYNPKTLERMTKTALVCYQFCCEHKEYPDLISCANAFSRICFRNIISNDFLNKNNPNPWRIRKASYLNALQAEPYKSAFEKKNMTRTGSYLNDIEIELVSKHSFICLYMFRKVRQLLRATAGR